MKCSDFLWEWRLLRDEPAARQPQNSCHESPFRCMPRCAPRPGIRRSQSLKEAPKALKESADRCEAKPETPFWDGVFKTVLDEAVPK
jgi:hypothetical protein